MAVYHNSSLTKGAWRRTALKLPAIDVADRPSHFEPWTSDRLLAMCHVDSESRVHRSVSTAYNLLPEFSPLPQKKDNKHIALTHPYFKLPDKRGLEPAQKRPAVHPEIRHKPKQHSMDLWVPKVTPSTSMSSSPRFSERLILPPLNQGRDNLVQAPLQVR